MVYKYGVQKWCTKMVRKNGTKTKNVVQTLIPAESISSARTYAMCIPIDPFSSTQPEQNLNSEYRILWGIDRVQFSNH